MRSNFLLSSSDKLLRTSLFQLFEFESRLESGGLTSSGMISIPPCFLIVGTGAICESTELTGKMETLDLWFDFDEVEVVVEVVGLYPVTVRLPVVGSLIARLVFDDESFLISLLMFDPSILMSGIIAAVAFVSAPS